MSRPLIQRTATAVEDYIARAGGCCPCCGSKDIEPGRVQAARGRATGDFECFACHARWREVYTLSTIEVLTGQGHRKKTPMSAEVYPVAAPTLDALLEAMDIPAGGANGAVADLRDLMRAAWRLMTPAQRVALSRERALAKLAASPERETSQRPPSPAAQGGCGRAR